MTFAHPDDVHRLSDEAHFADRAYAKFAAQLVMNQTFFRKYASPSEPWDWRQWGAARLGSVEGCQLLDYGCGAGEEAVYLASMGAHVTAIDISPVGVQLATERARVNGVGDRVRAVVMRCDPTEFPDDSFDVIHGFGILHHVGLATGLEEVERLLKPRGRALFFEHMGNSRLIEWFRPQDGDYTENEKPVVWSDVKRLCARFAEVEMKPFHLIARLRNRIPWCGSPAVKRLDDLMLTACPPLRHFASGLVIYLRK